MGVGNIQFHEFFYLFNTFTITYGINRYVSSTQIGVGVYKAQLPIKNPTSPSINFRLACLDFPSQKPSLLRRLRLAYPWTSLVGFFTCVVAFFFSWISCLFFQWQPHIPTYFPILAFSTQSFSLELLPKGQKVFLLWHHSFPFSFFFPSCL